MKTCPDEEQQPIISKNISSLTMETELCELESARELLSDLRSLLPELLSRCQQVGKCRSKLLKGVEGDEAKRIKFRLEKAELERDALRQHILSRVEMSGDTVAEVRRIISACISLDNIALEMPLAAAIPEFCKSVPARRKDLLDRVKKLRNTLKIMRDTERGTQAVEEKHKDDMSFDSQEDMLKQHLTRLHKLLGKLEQCTTHLSRVKGEKYIAKYESERATLKNEQKFVRELLQNWLERNEQHGSQVWERHGELAGAMVAALSENIEDVDLTRAMREDLAPFVVISTPRSTHVVTRRPRPSSSVSYPNSKNKIPISNSEDISRLEERQSGLQFCLPSSSISKGIVTQKREPHIAKLHSRRTSTRSTQLQVKHGEPSLDLSLSINGLSL